MNKNKEAHCYLFTIFFAHTIYRCSPSTSFWWNKAPKPSISTLQISSQQQQQQQNNREWRNWSGMKITCFVQLQVKQESRKVFCQFFGGFFVVLATISQEQIFKQAKAPKSKRAVWKPQLLLFKNVLSSWLWQKDWKHAINAIHILWEQTETKMNQKVFCSSMKLCF